MVLAIAVVYYIVAVISLHLIVFPVTRSVGGGEASPLDPEIEWILHAENPLHDDCETQRVSVDGTSRDYKRDGFCDLSNVTLCVLSNSQERMKLVTEKGDRYKLLLGNIRACIRPSRLTALMGSSGSGRDMLRCLVYRN